VTEQMRQLAPYPEALKYLVGCLKYRTDRGWSVYLSEHVRDTGPDGEILSKGLTLVVYRCGPDSYDPNRTIGVNHFFPVPPATYDRRSWQRWLFDRLGDVDTHERMEDFQIRDSPGSEHVTRPYAPSHGPGNDPYMVREVGTTIDQRTSYRGVLDE
jgi:hypothetical protein